MIEPVGCGAISRALRPLVAREPNHRIDPRPQDELIAIEGLGASPQGALRGRGEGLQPREPGEGQGDERPDLLLRSFEFFDDLLATVDQSDEILEVLAPIEVAATT